MKKLWSLLLTATVLLFACEKEKSFELGEDSQTETSWQFKDTSSTVTKGNADSYELDPTGTEIVYQGTTADGNGDFYLSVLSLSGTLKPGTYKSSLGQVTFSYSEGGIPKYAADAIDSVGEDLTVTILYVDSARITGTFTGTMRTASGAVIAAREGQFQYAKTVTTGASEGTLGTSGDSCTGVVLAGGYHKGIAINSVSNTATVNVNVTKAGSYTIGTDTVNGIYFTKTATFSATGVQAVVLGGVGTPTDSGTFTLKVKYGTSRCAFVVKVDTSTTTPVPTGDYLPLTTGSNWTYSYSDGDTSRQLVVGRSATVNGVAYSVSTDTYGSGDVDSTLYRKASGLYYSAINLDNLVQMGGIKETILLKDNIAVGGTWTDQFTVATGVTASIKYTIQAKAVSASVGSLNFADVIKVTGAISMGGMSFGSMEIWFARGVGRVYFKYTDVTNVSTETKLTRYQVL